IFLRIPAARPRALDGPRLDFALLNCQEPLRRGADYRELAQVKIASKRRSVSIAQPAIQLQRMLALRVEQALGEIHLEAVAGMNVVNSPAGRGQVRAAREIARQQRLTGNGYLARHTNLVLG